MTFAACYPHPLDIQQIEPCPSAFDGDALSYKPPRFPAPTAIELPNAASIHLKCVKTILRRT